MALRRHARYCTSPTSGRYPWSSWSLGLEKTFWDPCPQKSGNKVGPKVRDVNTPFPSAHAIITVHAEIFRLNYENKIMCCLRFTRTGPHFTNLSRQYYHWHVSMESKAQCFILNCPTCSCLQACCKVPVPCFSSNASVKNNCYLHYKWVAVNMTCIRILLFHIMWDAKQWNCKSLPKGFNQLSSCP